MGRGAFSSSSPGSTSIVSPTIDATKDIPSVSMEPSHTEGEKSTVRQGADPVSVQQVKRKLFTKEDRGHFHKIFGTLALASFVYRYAWVWPRTGSLGLEFDTLGVATMVVHTLLSSSSLFFRVPLRRIRRKPTMIWEEYRLHAIVFTFRCAFVYALGVVTERQGASFVDHPNSPKTIAPTLAGQAVRIVAVLAMHVAADIITIYWGAPGHTTVRGNNSRTPRMALVRHLSLVYAFYQFLALASHLLPYGPSGMDLAYNTLIAIQSSAFCMTLHRKSLIRWQTHAVVYGICLFVSSAFILSTLRSWTFFGAALAAFLARTQLRVNKYVIWTAFAFSWVYGAPAAAACGASAALYGIGKKMFGSPAEVADAETKTGGEAAATETPNADKTE